MSPEENKEGSEGKVLAVASGKGGTGKTVSTLNLGMALHEMGEDVIVMDGDLEDPNLGVNLGIYSPENTLNEILEEEKNIFEALHVHDSGLRIIPASLSINYLNSNLEAIESAVENLGGYVLIDCGPGLDEKMASILKASDGVIIVTNPIRSSISGVIRLVEFARDLQKDVEGLIVNNTTLKEISLDEIENISGSSILGEVPYDSKVDEAIVNRKPLLDHRPHSPASTAFRKIAHKLIGKKYERPLRHRLKGIYGSFKSFLSG